MKKNILPPRMSFRQAVAKLSKSKGALEDLEKFLGTERMAEAVKAMQFGELERGIGADVHDFFLDQIHNEATPVWSGRIVRSKEEGQVPIMILKYHGVYFVQIFDSDDLKYFSSLAGAREALEFDWGGSVVENRG